METRDKHNALGLCAPQIGVHLRVIALAPYICGVEAMINPEIITSGKDNASHDEACLSVAGGTVRHKVKRSTIVTVRYLDPRGEGEKTITLKRLAARVVQHEIDHLDGKLITGEEAKLPSAVAIRS